MIPAVGLMMIPRESLDLPVGQIGVRLLRGRGECVGGRGEGLDSPGGRIGVSLLTGAWDSDCVWGDGGEAAEDVSFFECAV